MDSSHSPPLPVAPNRSMRGTVDLAYAVSVLAGLPIALCMAIMGVPDLAARYALDFRILYTCTFIFWIFPLAVLQRRLWQSRLSWSLMALALLFLSYGMSLINSLLGHLLAMRLGLVKALEWSDLFSGLDGCWLALIAYCAVHAVLIYSVALGREQRRSEQALALARDAQLRALRYQIHPHFLFNTLNAISTLVLNERNREANRMINHLGDFLRATLESEDCHEHALADELALTESYLDIEKARLGNRLAIAMHVGPDALQVYVPYLLLQPLMENAIRHGIAPRSTGGQIDLTIERTDAWLQIRLCNDVVADEATGNAPDRHSCGVGLRNVMERLDQLYAGQHSFRVGRTATGQFQVSMVIPYRARSYDQQSWPNLASRAA